MQDLMDNDASTSADGGDRAQFGGSIAISGDTMFVGASTAGTNNSTGVWGNGAVYIYQKSGGLWVKTQQLLASDGQSDDSFGVAVAASGSTLLVGAQAVTINGNLVGAFYVFTYTAGTWIETQKLLDPDGGQIDLLGHALAIDGTNALVGALGAPGVGGTLNGAVYAYSQSADGTWSFTQKLVAEDGQEYDDFGIAVAMQGTTAIIGSPQVRVGGQPQGAVYMFTLQGGVWAQTQKMVGKSAIEGNPWPNFGQAVAIDGSSVLVGEPGATIGTNQAQGAAYVFNEGADGTWTQTQQLTASNGAAQDEFGHSVALQGAQAIVGAPNVLYGNEPWMDSGGAAYSFLSGGDGTFAQYDQLHRSIGLSDGWLNDQLGASVAVNGSEVAVGMLGSLGRAPNGTVVVFNYPAFAMGYLNTVSFSLPADATLSQQVPLGDRSPQPLHFTATDGAELDQMTMTKTSDLPIAPGDGIACYYSDLSGNPAQSWYRRFYFNEYPQVGAAASVDSVTVASEAGPDGTAAMINLYTIPHSWPVDTIDRNQLTLVGSAIASVGGLHATTTVPVSGAVADTVNQDLVVEYHIAGASPTPFWPAGNPSPQTHTTLWISPECGVTGISNNVLNGFHLLMSVHLDPVASSVTCGNPTTTPWLQVQPSGTIAAGDIGYLTIGVDSTGLSAGTYAANACLDTNDPVHRLLQTRVNMTVTSSSDTIFHDGFDGSP